MILVVNLENARNPPSESYRLLLLIFRERPGAQCCHGEVVTTPWTFQMDHRKR